MHLGLGLGLAGYSRRNGGFSPSTLFALAEPGVWFDPSDTSTLFQDPAGTTPVTAPGNTVGLMLDKSKGLALGAELITNAADRDFSSDTGFWTKNAPEISIGGGVCAFASAADSRGIERNFFVTPGKYYEITFTVVSRASGGFQAYVGNPVGATYTAPGTYTQRLMCSGNNYIGVVARGTTTGSIDNISVKEVAGNHATQAITAARPTYSIEPVGGRRNIFTQSEAFNEGVWQKIDGIVSPNTAETTDPLGGNTADKLTHASAINILQEAAGVSGDVRTFSCYLKKSGTQSTCELYIYKLTIGFIVSFSFNFDTGVATLTQGSGSATMQPIGATGWYRCSVTGTLNASIGYSHGVYNAAAVYAWGAQLELGSTASAYQRVTTQHDVTEAGVASVGYLWFDGVSNNMVTSSVNFTSTNKMTAFAGYRAIEKTGSTLMLELSTNAFTSSGAFSFNQGPNAATTGFGALMNTGSGIGAQTTPLTIPYTSVASLKLDSALVGLTNEISLRMDGVAVALPVNSGGDSGTGNFGNYPFYIGARSGNIAPFKGHIYSIIARGAATDAPTIASTETWVAGKTGITI